MPLTFELLDKPDLADVKLLGEGLNAHAALAGYPSEWVELAIFARDEKGLIRAGLAGNTGQGLLYVRLLWVHEEHRKQGLGRKLLTMAEAEAMRRGCRTAGIDTFSFQAPQYYPKLGYREFGRIERLGAKRDITRYWFVKDLE